MVLLKRAKHRPLPGNDAALVGLDRPRADTAGTEGSSSSLNLRCGAPITGVGECGDRKQATAHRLSPPALAAG